MSVKNFLIVLVLCAVVGAFTGLLLGGSVGDLYLGITAGLLATVIASAARNLKIPQLAVIYSALAIEHAIPVRVIIYSVVASIIAGAAAVGVASETDLKSSIIVGSLAGLFAGLLMLMLIIVSEKPNGEERA
ncbi:hypothetical protein [Methyloceanibacter sp.]|jgi:hypothetical protein|uniref:hypothetical protein n=1 Tax=Methyloceanibacter sp. TaxID=1965321 RepID=UPI0035680CD3